MSDGLQPPFQRVVSSHDWKLVTSDRRYKEPSPHDSLPPSCEALPGDPRPRSGPSRGTVFDVNIKAI